NHPASNLLNRDTYRKWKCKEAGEKEAFVILKFDQAVNFNCVDIGNDGSALVEVFVARSGSGEPQYEVLLSSTAFMSPLDSREGKNSGGVKSFSLNYLCKPIAAQKWDLVKILVSQPFNRHVQYGLTFIKFTAAPDPNEPKKIGIFALRKPLGGVDSDDDDD
ncbi:DNA repair protein XRCC1, partial [Orchesella cincta]